jgi:hypothetical protein
MEIYSKDVTPPHVTLMTSHQIVRNSPATLTQVLASISSSISLTATRQSSRCHTLHLVEILRPNSGSSGSIVSDYGLDDRAIEVRSPTGADISSSPCVQTGSGAHPASYPMGTGGSFPGGKARPADHSPPSTAEVKNE